jgi:phosphoglycerol transferase MdoB-like AlkP superfamily enzyme
MRSRDDAAKWASEGIPADALLTQQEGGRPRVAKGWRETALFFALTVLLPTGLLYFLSKRFGFTVPIFNLDLLVLCAATAIIAMWRPALAVALAALGVGAITCLQILLGVGLVYIDDPALIGEYLQFAGHWPWGLISTWALVAVIAIVALYFVLRRVDVRRVRAWPAIAILVALLSLDLAGRTELGFSLIKTNPTTSTANRTFSVLKKWARSPGFTYVAHPGASMAAELNGGSLIPDRILSISVEAFGLADDQAFNDAIRAPLESRLAGTYSIEARAHPYKGATLAGELRELCGLRISGTPTRAAATSIRPRCLPAHLDALGYSTTAMHGNSRFFYNRGELYSALGFQRTYFYEELSVRGSKICSTRSFSGICDDDVLAVAMRSLEGGSKAFVHVMTLETHFPLTATTPEDRRCDSAANEDARALCVYKNSFRRAMNSIASAIETAKVKPDVVYIYGDHAPPYVLVNERSFFKREEVPVIVLRRR